MKRILEADAEIVTLVFSGAQDVWPWKVYYGGLPGTIKASVHKVTTSGSNRFLRRLRDGGSDPADALLSDVELLGKKMRELMQSQYNMLTRSVEGVENCAMG